MDPAHDWTDDQIEALGKRFEGVYGEAARDMRKKLDDFLAKYEKQNASWQKMLANGEAKQAEYEAWLEQMTMDRQFMEGLTNRLATDATNANQKALDMVNDRIPRVYAENANYGAYQVESGLGFDTHSFDLYDESTVRRLMATTEHDQLIHEVIPVGPARPDLQSLRVNLDAAKDVQWNRQKFTAAVTQSILQGESIPNAAKRLMGVLNMDRSMATRAARTAMTGAENAGRVDSYKRAKAMGIDLEQEWMATLDERTRYSHRQLDGQHVPVGKKFEVEGHEIEFPGDPKAHPSETYNCRCTLVAWLPGIEKEDPKRWSRLPEGMSYDEWKGTKEYDVRPQKNSTETLRARLSDYVGGGYELSDILTDADVKWMHKNEETYSQPLYRIEDGRFTASKLDKAIENEDEDYELSFGDTYRSFTSGGNDTLEELASQFTEAGYNLDDYVVFKTVGKTSGFDMAPYAQEYMDDQKEVLVDGTFEFMGESSMLLNGRKLRIIVIRQMR